MQDKSYIQATSDKIEETLMPRGRCTKCGGGESYWKHREDDSSEYHAFKISSICPYCHENREEAHGYIQGVEVVCPAIGYFPAEIRGKKE